ncbi:hypothetical protein [Lacrimispora sp.]|uniref:hypothetical protein n=1 Tax=Lacrimispora sp. TaxID=2719234 RepID=UPI0028AD28D1|nr:hypothetical protein [Lacrimispora sp.]
MLKVDIKTSYSEESFIIPDWQSDVHSNYYGRKFFDEEDYADFYLRGPLCFCCDFEIVDLRKASQEEVEEYCQRHENDQEDQVKEIMSLNKLQ